MIQRYNISVDYDDGYRVEKSYNGIFVKHEDVVEYIEHHKPKVCKWAIKKRTANKLECETECGGLHMYLLTYNNCPYCGGKIEIEV